MARFYANENFPLPVVERLRQLGHDVTTVQETGKGSQQTSDDVVLQTATADRRAVLTLNRKHFVRLHHASPNHAGIVACTVDADFEGQARASTTLSPVSRSWPASCCESIARRPEHQRHQRN